MTTPWILVDGDGHSADGVAFTIVGLTSAGSLTNLVGGTEDGGGIGYHYPAAIGVDAASAVTIEIDQFYDTCAAGAWDADAEATSLPHLAVHTTLSSRPSGMVDHVELPGITDGQWHEARIDIVGGTLRIYIDGDLKLTATPGVTFEGGHMFFSS